MSEPRETEDERENLDITNQLTREQRHREVEVSQYIDRPATMGKRRLMTKLGIGDIIAEKSS